MKKYTKAFSFVELIMSLGVIIILGVIASTGYSSMQEKSNNSKTISDLRTINNALTTYKDEKKSLPLPSGNLSFYKDDTSYAHSYDESFGVSGFITSDTIDKKYLSFSPIDSKTNQYYGYGKTKDYLSFELAGVIYENNTPTSMVVGNWGGEVGPYNLVKEYAGPNFVYDKSTDYFPYNPLEKQLVGKVSSFSGSLEVNGKNISQNDIKDLVLMQGDEIISGTGGNVNIYYSDGSNTVLGDKNSYSKLQIAKLAFNNDSNLFTSIKLALSQGSIWTKAAKQDNNSDFGIYTPDQVAAVRGTIFGVSKDSSSSTITLVRGKLKVGKINNSTGNLITSIENNNITSENLTITGVTTQSGSESFIEVKAGENIKGIKSYTVPTNGGGVSSYNFSYSGATLSIPDGLSGSIINGIGELNSNIQIGFLSYTGGVLSLKTNEILNNSKYLFINNFPQDNWQATYLSGSTLKITNFDSTNNTKNISIKICNDKDSLVCSKTLNINLENSLNYINNQNLNLSYDCAEGSVKFGKYGCIDNNFYSSGYSIIAYAPLSYMDYNLHYQNGDIINIGSGDIYSNGNNYFTTGANIKYNLENLISKYDLKTGSTGSKIGYEFEISGKKLLENPTFKKYILSYTSGSLFTMSGSFLAFNTNISTGTTNKGINPNSYYKVYTILDGNYGEIGISGITKAYHNNFTAPHIQQIISVGNKINENKPFNGEIKNFKIYYKPE